MLLYLIQIVVRFLPCQPSVQASLQRPGMTQGCGYAEHRAGSDCACDFSSSCSPAVASWNWKKKAWAGVSDRACLRASEERARSQPKTQTRPDNSSPVVSGSHCHRSSEDNTDKTYTFRVVAPALSKPLIEEQVGRLNPKR